MVFSPEQAALIIRAQPPIFDLLMPFDEKESLLRALPGAVGGYIEVIDLGPLYVTGVDSGPRSITSI